MRKIILEINDNYSKILTLTAVGSDVFQTRVSTRSVDLSKCTHLLLREDGDWEERYCPEEEE